MQLSQKQNALSQFSFPIRKSRFNFGKFQKRDDPHSWCIIELSYSENRG